MSKSSDNGFKIFGIFIIKFFSSNYTEILINLIMTTLIGVHTSKLGSKNWLGILLIYVTIDIILNFILVACKEYNKSKDKWLSVARAMYNDHSKKYSIISSQTFRINKEIEKTINENVPVSIDCYNKIYDFQSLAIEICKSIYELITNEIKDCSCQVTIMQRTKLDDGKDGCKMIAYANKNDKEPASYHTIHKLKGSNKAVFQKCFCNNEATPIIYNKKKDIVKNFVILNTSKNREESICQYIGIPIKTNRNVIELIMQIDVSEPHVFGYTKEGAKQFCELLIPYSNLLLEQYEKELILVRFYELLVNSLPKGVKKDVS